jgi:hypothetical protein
LSQNQSQSQSQIPVPPKLNFKSAIQGNQGNQGNRNQGNQGQGQGQINQGNQGNPINPSSQSQIPNQFLRRPMNQFLHSVNRVRYDDNENEPNDVGDSNDAYDSAYTKYYDD